MNKTIEDTINEQINAQVEEEKTAAQILDQLRMLGDQKGPLLFIDCHLRKREE